MNASSFVFFRNRRVVFSGPFEADAAVGVDELGAEGKGVHGGQGGRIFSACRIGDSVIVCQTGCQRSHQIFGFVHFSIIKTDSGE